MTFNAYLPGFEMLTVLATVDFAGSTTTMSPDQLGVSSVLWQFWHILPVVSVRHFLQVNSLGIETHFFPVLAGSFSLASVFLAPAFCAFATSSSIHSNAPRNGCLQVTPILPNAAPLGRLTAVILTLTLLPILRVRFV